MTVMQAVVKNSDEIEQAFDTGVDFCLIDPSIQDKPGFDARAIAAIAAPHEPERLGLLLKEATPVELADVAHHIGRFFLRLGKLDEDARVRVERLVAHLPQGQLYGVFSAATGWTKEDLAWLASLHFRGAMLDAAEPGAAFTEPRLLRKVGIVALLDFAEACHAVSLETGFTGALETPDITRLMVLAPDFLSFGRALRFGHSLEADFDPASLSLVRSMLPRGSETEPADAPQDDILDTVPENSIDDETCSAVATDRIFVHDLIRTMSIGAYAAERAAPQRVRINVDLAIERLSERAESVRDVFSYDLIIDRIELLLARGHVVVLETLAEDLAEALLRHDRVREARIRIEKLDVLDAIVGIELIRERSRKPLFPRLAS
ncbi:dihydroneopterin aldolase [Beijerinckia mobilis]|uniref:dihydroneopterin aldolase n=1 Tax=Beijerinckia mobilis TaxID=231434 RepID=UPI00068ACE7F|nr:dihydroneopterin aldolase [Beijerinckia mobilis]